MAFKHKNLSFEIKAAEEETIDGEQYLTVTGIAAAYTKDCYSDIIIPGAFKISLQKSPEIPALWQHRSDEPVGVWRDMEEVKEGLRAKAYLPLSDSFVKERLKPQLLIKSIRALSIGYRVVTSHMGRVDDEDVCYLDEIELMEVSFVTFPANTDAVITEVKSLSSKSLQQYIDNPTDLKQLLCSGGFKCSDEIADKIVAALLKSDESEVIEACESIVYRELMNQLEKMKCQQQ